jgi:hypothetical protein
VARTAWSPSHSWSSGTLASCSTVVTARTSWWKAAAMYPACRRSWSVKGQGSGPSGSNGFGSCDPSGYSAPIPQTRQQKRMHWTWLTMCGRRGAVIATALGRAASRAIRTAGFAIQDDAAARAYFSSVLNRGPTFSLSTRRVSRKRPAEPCRGSRTLN